MWCGSGVARITTLLVACSGLPLATAASPTVSPATTAAPPVSQPTDWRSNRIQPLRKVTVGSADNFQPAVDSRRGTLYFSHSRDQVVTIQQQSLSSGVATPISAIRGDAREPALQPAGELLAFTSLQADPQGEICLLPLTAAAATVRCLSDTTTLDRSPFWVGNDHLGFLSRGMLDRHWQLILYRLADGSRQPLLTGQINAPTATRDGRYILYTESDQPSRSHLRILRRADGQILQPPPFDLPGVTGFSTLSEDDRYLYFSHYLNDTSLDQVIDGEDHGVIFRLPFADLLAAATDPNAPPLRPQQLTTVAEHCSFPDLAGDQLWLTCAFEGSLDIYRTAPSGRVPAHWQAADLWQAHATSRSNEERLLLLNALYQQQAIDRFAWLERSLSEHLQIGELSAARYYVAQLQHHPRSATHPQLRHFWPALTELLKVEAAYAIAPEGVITAPLRHALTTAEAEIKQRQIPPSQAQLWQVWLAQRRGDRAQALAHLHTIDLTAPMLPLARYLLFERYQQLLREADPALLLSHYPAMFRAPELEPAARLWYGFDYLRLLTQITPNISDRQQQIAQQQHALPPEVATLFQGEQLTLSLLTLSADAPAATRRAALQPLLTLLREQANSPLLRQRLHTRAIQLLAAAERFSDMELLSRHWLSTTAIREIDFAQVVEQYAAATLDKGYGMLNSAPQQAYTTFYSAIRQSDDLEAHFQFIRLGLDPGLNRRDNLVRSYQQLQREQLLGASDGYYQALQRLLTTPPAAQAQALTEAIALLQQPLNSAVSTAPRELLLGYCYHQQLRLAQQQGEGVGDRLQRANHHYLLALDLGYDNLRLAAAAWQNLAWLHHDVGNHALAADFFARRLSLPFTTLEQQLLTQIGHARALFASHATAAAATAGETALAQVTPDHPLYQPLLERSAFWQLQAANYPQAIARYQQLLASTPPLRDENRAKALLGYAFAQRQMGASDAAQQRLQQLLPLLTDGATADRVQTAPRALPFQPQRLALIAYGLLAQLTDDPAQQRHWLSERLQLLQQLDATEQRQLGYDEARWLALLTRLQLQLAAVVEAQTDGEALIAHTRAAIQHAAAWQEVTGSDSGPVIEQTVSNAMSLLILHPRLLQPALPLATLQQLAAGAIAALQSAPWRSAVDEVALTRLQRLTAAVALLIEP